MNLSYNKVYASYNHKTKINLNCIIKLLPAIGGPAANDIPIKPLRNPIACAAPDGPHISYAIGPSTTQKHPSAKPSPMQKTINTDQLLVTFNNIVRIPIARKDT